jgi:hypothetical protein
MAQCVHCARGEVHRKCVYEFGQRGTQQAAAACSGCAERDAEIARLLALLADNQLTPANKLTDVSSSKANRREYQCDLMRKRRAAAKVAKVANA